MPRPDIEIGDLVKERITGFTGVVVATDELLNIVLKAQVQPRELKEGQVVKPDVFDFEALEIVEKQVVAPTPVAYDPGYEVGDRVKDRYSDFYGIVKSRRVSHSGCIQYGVYPEKVIIENNPKPRGGLMFLAAELERIKVAAKAPVDAGKSGPAPIARSSREW